MNTEEGHAWRDTGASGQWPALRKEDVKAKYPVVGEYVAGLGHTHTEKQWDQICGDHEEEFPQIRQCSPGTMNIAVKQPPGWYLPMDTELRNLAGRRGRGDCRRYKDGNYISPLAFVARINDVQLPCWFYAGSRRHKRKGIVELVSRMKIAKRIGVRQGDEVRLIVVELWTPHGGLPNPPPLRRRLDQ